MGKVIAVCVSEKKGEQKKPVDKIRLVKDWGIEGDAHAGKWHRQVSLLGRSSVDKLEKALDGMKLAPGAFAENILVEGGFLSWRSGQDFGLERAPWVRSPRSGRNVTTTV